MGNPPYRGFQLPEVIGWEDRTASTYRDYSDVTRYKPDDPYAWFFESTGGEAPDLCNTLLGLHFDREQITRILRAAGLRCEEDLMEGADKLRSLVKSREVDVPTLAFQHILLNAPKVRESIGKGLKATDGWSLMNRKNTATQRLETPSYRELAATNRKRRREKHLRKSRKKR